MRLFVIRHGEALSPLQDPHRPLSPHGRTQARSIGKQLAQLGGAPGCFWHSTKPRAVETAALIAAELSPAPDIAQVSGLLPEDDIAPLVARAEAHDADLVLVSHLPLVHELCTHLLAEGGELAPRFTECTVAQLRRAEGSWTLETVLSPR